MSTLSNEDFVHQLKNHIGAVIGFVDLLLLEVVEGDAKRPDLQEVRIAAHAAMAMMPEVARRCQAGSAPTTREDS